jgi:hypothetical protein
MDFVRSIKGFIKLDNINSENVLNQLHFFYLAQQPPEGQDLLILEVSR